MLWNRSEQSVPVRSFEITQHAVFVVFLHMISLRNPTPVPFRNRNRIQTTRTASIGILAPNFHGSPSRCHDISTAEGTLECHQRLHQSFDISLYLLLSKARGNGCHGRCFGGRCPFHSWLSDVSLLICCSSYSKS